jgi:hypothetical protein
MARNRKLLLIGVAFAIVACIVSCSLLQQRRADAARRELAAITPQIASISLYDLHIGDPDTAELLSSAISAPFPVDVFVRAASSAEHRSGHTPWKGSSLAVLTLRDGSQRRARFSYYGGFFALDGTDGVFTVPGANSSDFHQRYIRFIQEQFVPQRRQRNNDRKRLTEKA